MIERLPHSSIPSHAGLKNRLAKWLTFLPPWLLALVLLLPVLLLNFLNLGNALGPHFERVSDLIVAFLPFAVLFIIAALQRVNWRHILVMLVLAAVWTGLVAVMTPWVFRLPFPYAFAVSATMPITAVGLGEWFLNQSRVFKSLLWVLLLSVAVGCFIPLITKPLDFTREMIRGRREMIRGRSPFTFSHASFSSRASPVGESCAPAPFA
jgi:hypothetical protein